MSAQINMTHTPARMQTPSSPTLLLGLFVLGAIVALIGVWAWHAAHHENSTPATAVSSQPNRAATAGAQPAAANATTQAQVEMLTTTLSATGFTPAVLDHAAGTVKLKVKNESEQEEIVLRLSKASGEKLSEVMVSKKVHAWVGKFELGAGAYTLTEANHADWVCRLNLTAP